MAEAVEAEGGDDVVRLVVGNQMRQGKTAGGHGPVGTKEDVTAALAYLDELRAAVLEGLKAGQSVDELAASITMDRYSDWINYDEWREGNVRGMARHLQETGQVK